MDWRERERQSNIESLRNETQITANGVIRWLSNGQVPPLDLVELAVEIGLPVDYEMSKKHRDIDVETFLSDYRKNRKISDEERFEARAAFGPGKVVIDVISGHKFIS